jgi:hypothetical protein
LVSGLGCLPVCAKAASARKRSGSARFMAKILVQFWVIRSHGDSRKYRGGETGVAASPRSIDISPNCLRSVIIVMLPDDPLDRFDRLDEASHAGD